MRSSAFYFGAEGVCRVFLVVPIDQGCLGGVHARQFVLSLAFEVSRQRKFYCSEEVQHWLCIICVMWQVLNIGFEHRPENLGTHMFCNAI